MKRKIIFGVLALVVVSAIALVGCGTPQITVNVPATPVTITAPVASTPSATGIMGSAVQDLIQIQMLKQVLDTGTDSDSNGGWHGGHHHGH